MATDTIDGYLGGEAYPSSFHRQFTPQWIDAMLCQRGLPPPRGQSRAPFALLDLGCGDGLALVGLAAAHPEGRFVGLDALPEHVERGTASARYAGLTNVAFFCGRFADVDADMDDAIEPTFDYVTAQGVLAWVSPDNRAHVRRLCGRHLKPGGVACIGYNTMPGWAHGLAVQQMLYLLSEEQEGGAIQRYAAALEQVRAIVAAGGPGDAGGAGGAAKFLAWLDGISDTLPARYFPYEYLNRHWQPLWSGQEHAALAQHGLDYAGTSRAELLRPEFVLRPAQREALARIAGAHARETALDMMLDQTFRIDLFGRNLTPAGDSREVRLGGWWAAAATAADADFTLVSPAGEVAFDTPAARGVLAALADGPRRMSDVAASVRVEAGDDLPYAIDALWASGQILPCDPPLDPPAAGVFNRLNAAAARAGAPLTALVGRHGLMPAAQAEIVAAGEGDRAAMAGLVRKGIAPDDVAAAGPLP